ncbi:uncharacterized protein LOC126284046 [Schistocerca gregaria]|uniref:uncharacterized protein LOC126284046 n=1 Tax=Schistocerca gregaria TaxID=7010 RepID=UPI00211F05FE|nr:uncharacterized protein LOC126284046 [Schistocerca gregaria]XP_049838582.1 uncharacterized protein LOC126284046 [Schistocerca gregaria]
MQHLLASGLVLLCCGAVLCSGQTRRPSPATSSASTAAAEDSSPAATGAPAEKGNCTSAVPLQGPEHTVTELRFPGGSQTRFAATLFAQPGARLLVQLAYVDVAPGVFECELASVRVYSYKDGQLTLVDRACGSENRSTAVLTEGGVAIVTYATVLPSSNASGNSTGAFTVLAQVLGAPSYQPGYRPPTPTQITGNYNLYQTPPTYYFNQIDRNDVGYQNSNGPYYKKPASYYYLPGKRNSRYQPPSSTSPPLLPPTGSYHQRQYRNYDYTKTPENRGYYEPPGNFDYMKAPANQNYLKTQQHQHYLQSPQHQNFPENPQNFRQRQSYQNDVQQNLGHLNPPNNVNGFPAGNYHQGAPNGPPPAGTEAYFDYRPDGAPGQPETLSGYHPDYQPPSYLPTTIAPPTQEQGRFHSQWQAPPISDLQGPQANFPVSPLGSDGDFFAGDCNGSAWQVSSLDPAFNNRFEQQFQLYPTNYVWPQGLAQD